MRAEWWPDSSSVIYFDGDLKRLEAIFDSPPRTLGQIMTDERLARPLDDSHPQESRVPNLIGKVLRRYAELIRLEDLCQARVCSQIKVLRSFVNGDDYSLIRSKEDFSEPRLDRLKAEVDLDCEAIYRETDVRYLVQLLLDFLQALSQPLLDEDALKMLETLEQFSVLEVDTRISKSGSHARKHQKVVVARLKVFFSFMLADVQVSDGHLTIADDAIKRLGIALLIKIPQLSSKSRFSIQLAPTATCKIDRFERLMKAWLAHPRDRMSALMAVAFYLNRLL